MIASAAPYTGARYDPASPRGHVESYFLKANHPRERRAIWIKSTIFAPSRTDPGALPSSHALAEAWAICFDSERGHVATKSAVPYERAAFARDRMELAVDGCTLDAQGAKGAIETGSRRISWDLRFANTGAPPMFYSDSAWMFERGPSLKVVSPLPDLRVSGTVVCGDARWELDAWPGLVGHNWGRAHTAEYAWGHCNCWDDGTSAATEGSADVPPQRGQHPIDDLVFEGASGRLKAGPVLMSPRTTLSLRYRGVRYELNGLLDLARNRGRFDKRRWRLHGHNELIRVDGELWADTADLVGLYYPNPDGAMTYCLNTKLAHARLEIALPGRDAVVATSHAAALEIGTRDPHHGVTMFV